MKLGNILVNFIDGNSLWLSLDDDNYEHLIWCLATGCKSVNLDDKEAGNITILFDKILYFQTRYKKEVNKK